MSLNWYCVYAPVSEFEVEASLQHMAFQQAIPIDAYCPAITKWEKRRGQSFRIQLPLFPGYLFAGVGEDHRGEKPFPAVLGLEGVSAILGALGKYTEIPYELPEPRLGVLMSKDRGELPFSILGVRMLEHAHAFDFTRDRKKAAAAARRARLTFKSFADMARFLGSDNDAQPRQAA